MQFFQCTSCEALLMDRGICMVSIKGWRRTRMKARKEIMNRVKSVSSQNFAKSFFQRQKDTISTRASHVVTHRTTSRARTSLTSPSGREGVLLSLIWPKTWVTPYIHNTYCDSILRNRSRNQKTSDRRRWNGRKWASRRKRKKKKGPKQ